MATVEDIGGSYSYTTSVSDAVIEGLLTKIHFGEQEHYHCKLCNKNMAGVIPAQAHLKGTQHIKALKNYIQSRDSQKSGRSHGLVCDEVSSTSGNQSLDDARRHADLIFTMDSITDALKSGLILSKVLGSQKVMTCTICDIDCTGDVPMEQHIRGEAHLKRLKRKQVDCRGESVTRRDSPGQSIRAQRASPQTSVPLTSKQEGQSTEDSLEEALSNGVVKQAEDGDPSHLLCVACDTVCTGEEPMRQHIRGKPHRKKLRPRFRQREQSPAVVNSVQNTPLRPCEAVECSSTLQPAELFKSTVVKPERFSPPISSSTHTLDTKLKSAKEKGIILENDYGFECLICDKFLNGEASVVEHLEEDSHNTLLLAQITYEENIMGATSSREQSSSSMTHPSPEHKPAAVHLPASPPKAVSERTTAIDKSRNSARNSIFPLGQSSAENMKDVQVYLPKESLGSLFDSFE